MAKGEALLKAVQKKFFGPFRVSVMLDPNGSNTTAAAGVALLAKTTKLKGKKAVVLAGTGPVGMRAAAFSNAGIRELAPDLIPLLLFGTFWLVVGYFTFLWMERRARRTGAIGQY